MGKRAARVHAHMQAGACKVHLCVCLPAIARAHSRAHCSVHVSSMEECSPASCADEQGGAGSLCFLLSCNAYLRCKEGSLPTHSSAFCAVPLLAAYSAKKDAFEGVGGLISA
eukprot:1150099-Pelagomonas_calceolata.AAC.11